jgi:hypothetical protein
MPVDAPHPAYTVHRRLDGMEFQLEGLDIVVETLFRRARDGE